MQDNIRQLLSYLSPENQHTICSPSNDCQNNYIMSSRDPSVTHTCIFCHPLESLIWAQHKRCCPRIWPYYYNCSNNNLLAAKNCQEVGTISKSLALNSYDMNPDVKLCPVPKTLTRNCCVCRTLECRGGELEWL